MYSALAFGIAIPSLLLLLVRVGLFFQERRTQIYQGEETQYLSTRTGQALMQVGQVDTLELSNVTGQTPMPRSLQPEYASHNSNHAVRRAIDRLVLYDDTEIRHLVATTYSKKPELWPILRQEIGAIPAINTPLTENLARDCQIQYNLIKKKSPLDEDDLDTICQLLILSTWCLNVARDPLLIANTWKAIGAACNSLYILLPEKKRPRQPDWLLRATEAYKEALGIYEQHDPNNEDVLRIYNWLEQHAGFLQQLFSQRTSK